MKNLILLMAFLFLLSPFQARAQDVLPDRDATPATRLIAGCAIQVMVEGEDGLSGAYEIDSTGELHFTLDDGIGKHAEKCTVPVLNKTAGEACAAIAASLKLFIKMPQVTVIITRIPRLHVEVSGPVAKEGRVELPLAARLSDLLNVCACRENADLAHIRIFRKTKSDPTKPDAPAHTQIVAVNYETDEDPALEQNDRVLIAAREVVAPPKPTEYVRVVGEVGREVALPITGNLTITDALNRAGGLLPTADTQKMFLVRGSDGKYLEISAEEAMKGNPIHNLLLGPRDLLIVGKRDQSLIYSVAGEVKAPQTLAWKSSEHITLTQALAQAGGVTKNGDKRKGLLRKNFLRDPSKARLIVFDLDQIAKKKQPDWDIEAGDDIFIPPKQHRPSFFQQLAPLLLHFLPI